MIFDDPFYLGLFTGAIVGGVGGYLVRHFQRARVVATVEDYTDAVEALDALQRAEAEYRATHDFKGDDHRDTGRAWDRMRAAGNAARSLLFTCPASGYLVPRRRAAEVHHAS
jgi:hypothetical protein